MLLACGKVRLSPGGRLTLNRGKEERAEPQSSSFSQISSVTVPPKVIEGGKTRSFLLTEDFPHGTMKSGV